MPQFSVMLEALKVIMTGKPTLAELADALKTAYNIEVRDNRHLGMSIDVHIIGSSFPFVTIMYQSDKGFFLSTTGAWVGVEDARSYASSLNQLADIIEALNKALEREAVVTSPQ